MTPNTTTNGYRDVVRTFIEDAVLFGESDGLADDDSLTQTGVLDSTGVLEVVSFLESRYELSFDDSELVAANFDSITRIAALLATKAAA